VFSGHEVEQAADLLGEATLATHAGAEARIVELPTIALASAKGFESMQDLFAAQGAMGHEPIVEELPYAVGEAEDDMSRVLGACVGCGFEQGRRLRIC
jgi:hypothetical protein